MDYGFTTEWYLGIILILSLLILMLVEIGLCIVINIPFAQSPTKRGKQDIGPESREYNTRAIAFAGLTFAGITLLIDSSSKNLNEIQASLLVLTYSLCLFFISYKIEVLTGIEELYWIIQDKTLNYGFLSIVSALTTFFYEKLQNLVVIGLLMFLLIYIVHLIELKLDLEYRYTTKDLEKEK